MNDRIDKTTRVTPVNTVVRKNPEPDQKKKNGPSFARLLFAALQRSDQASSKDLQTNTKVP